MRWYVEEKPKKVIKIAKKGPEHGDVKIKIKFAFFPVKINETDYVWFEKYIETYCYRTNYETYKDEWVLARTNYYDSIRAKQFNKF